MAGRGQRAWGDPVGPAGYSLYSAGDRSCLHFRKEGPPAALSEVGRMQSLGREASLEPLPSPWPGPGASEGVSGQHQWKTNNPAPRRMSPRGRKGGCGPQRS